MKSETIPTTPLVSPFRPGTLFLMVALVTVATFGRAATHEFVDWDDRILIAINPRFNPPTWSSVLGYVWPRNADENLYIPATQMLWGLLAAIGHTEHTDPTGSLLDPWIFHLANLALHIASVGVVFVIMRYFASDLAAWIGAPLFAVHPLQVEAIAWATGLRDLLSGLLGFICLYELIRFRRTGKHGRWMVATVAAALSMLAKPAAVALPLEALALDILLLGARPRKSFGALWPWFVFTLPIVMITRHVQPPLWPIENPPLARPLIALDAIAFYVTRIFAPIHPVFDYGRTPHVALASGWRWTWMLPLLLAGVLTWKRRRLPRITGGCLLALAGIVPVLGLIAFEAQSYSTVSNHYLYPSMLGIALVAASLSEAAAQRFGGGIVIVFSLALTGAMAVQSFKLTGIWSSNYSLFTDELSVNPESPNGHTGLANALAAWGDGTDAEQHFRTAIHLSPHNGMAIMGLANQLLRNGDVDSAAGEFQRFIHVYNMQSNFDPKLGAAGEMVIATRLIQRADSAGAIAALEQAKLWDPQSPQLDALFARAWAMPSTRPATGTEIR
jgi:protein O-mannosyl-transferase